MLPVPVKPVSPESIARFKYRYGEQLMEFRNNLESRIEQIISIPDLETQADSINRFKKESKEKIEELTKNMESSGWGKITRGDWVILAGSGIGTFWPIIKTGIAIGTGIDPSISAEDVITSTGSGAILTGEMMRLRDHNKTEKEKLLDSKYAYVVLAKKEFG